VISWGTTKIDINTALAVKAKDAVLECAWKVLITFTGTYALSSTPDPCGIIAGMRKIGRTA
jgi:hypothetical protein